MKKILILYKREGETPLETLMRFRSAHSAYRDIKMTYAGRLDPMAEGLLLVLAGDAIKEKERYLKFDKEYQLEVLFGFATDTYDILGKIKSSKVLPMLRQRLQRSEANMRRSEFEKNVKKELKNFKGAIIQKYPLYSSRTVKGRPLFSYGRAGEEVEIPEHEVTIKKLDFLAVHEISARNLLKDIKKRLGKVRGDFRQKEIMSLWRKKLSGRAEEKFYLVTFAVACSSGTYVRALAHALGERVGLPALAYRIRRTRIGKFDKITGI